jgi:CheY-like chemotaxis protein
VYPFDEGFKFAILLVEDNPCDVVLFKQILRKCSVDCSLSVATDGFAALNDLRQSTSPAAERQFDVVFLDLNLPGQNGAEVLAEMKGDFALSSMPVAILTGSDHADDREICTSLGVDAYFNKALVLQDFFALVSDIDSFLAKLQDQRAPLKSSDLPFISAA